MNTELKIGGALKRRFTYQNVAFDFHLLREDRKTLSATVFPSQALVVKAPSVAGDERIHDFLRRKFRWILKQQRYFAQFRAQRGKRFVSGESFRYRGRSYKLLVRKDASNERVSLQHGTLTVFTTARKHSTSTGELITAWYMDRANRVFSERLSDCCRLFDHGEIPGFMVKRMIRRWGSYSQKTNRIILNHELIKASSRHIDYVIIHELCHVTHRKHGRPFYDLLASKLPEWEKLKTELELSLLG